MNSLVIEKHSSLAEGIMYADNAMKAYKEGIAEQSMLSNILPLLLIPLGAAGLAMGIDGANATAIAALGLTGAATLGVGNFWSSKPRQLVYAAGMKALVCAKTAMIPLDLAYDTHDGLEKNVRLLREALSQISTPVMDKSDQEIITKGREVLASGQKLLDEISRGNSRLINAVDDIDVEVTKAITTTIADPKSIQTTIGGLTAISTQFTAIPDSLKTKGPRGYGAGDNNRLLINKVSKYTGEVSSVVSTVATANMSEALKACQVESVVTGFTVQPPSPIMLQKDATQTLVIEGGRSPYSTILLDPVPSTELEVKAPVGIDNHASVTLKGAATKSKYRLYISDSAQHSMTIDLQPEKPPVLPGDGATPTVPPGGGANPTVPSGDGATPTVPPGDGATPTVPPGDGATPTVPPGDGATPTVPPGGGANPTVPPGGGANPTVPSGNGAKPTAPRLLGTVPSSPSPTP